MFLRLHTRAVLALISAFVGLSALPAFQALLEGAPGSVAGFDLCVHPPVGTPLARSVHSEARGSQPSLTEETSAVPAICPQSPALFLAAVNDNQSPLSAADAAEGAKSSGGRQATTASARGPPFV